MFLYYVLLTVISLLAFTLTVRDSKRYTMAVLRYFECEKNGVTEDSDNPCDRSGYTIVLNIILRSMSYILLGFYPMVNFIFVINIRELKKYLKKKFSFLSKIPKRKPVVKHQVSDKGSNITSSRMSYWYALQHFSVLKE